MKQSIAKFAHAGIQGLEKALGGGGCKKKSKKSHKSKKSCKSRKSHGSKKSHKSYGGGGCYC